VSAKDEPSLSKDADKVEFRSDRLSIPGTDHCFQDPGQLRDDGQVDLELSLDAPGSEPSPPKRFAGRPISLGTMLRTMPRCHDATMEGGGRPVSGLGPRCSILACCMNLRNEMSPHASFSLVLLKLHVCIIKLVQPRQKNDPLPGCRYDMM